MNPEPKLEDVLLALRPYGVTDEGYLKHHFARFRETKRAVCATWDATRGRRVLDVGAHWLHQSWLWQVDGFSVTAVDLPLTFELDPVRALAQATGMTLLPCRDLERADELDSIPSDSIDILLFTEIIEHITFNPVRFWQQIYRVLAPGARIVVTTPNYYAARGRAWNPRRFLRGYGGGLSVDEVLNTPTYGHHWREFSMLELIRYFRLLSPDFRPVRACYPSSYGFGEGGVLGQWVQRCVPFLRPNLHLEIELAQKQAGITPTPQWK